MLIAAYSAAVSLILTLLLRNKDIGEGFLVLSFASAGFAASWKFSETSQIPMRTLADVFVLMGAMSWPVAAFCRRKYSQKFSVADCLWACCMLFPAYYAFDNDTKPLVAVLRSGFFAPHVFSCLLGYAFIFKGSIAAGKLLFVRRKDAALADVQISALNFLATAALLFMCIGTFLGSIWGAQVWTDWWNWDPKEMIALSTIFMLAACIGFGKKAPVGASYSIFAAAALAVINLLWANLSSIFAGLHNYA